MRHLLLASAALVVACSGGTTAEPPPAQSQPTDTGTPTEDTATTIDAAAVVDAPPAADACASRVAQPLDATWSLTVDGVARTFDVHVPARYVPSNKTPIVFNFHGYTSDSKQQNLLAKMNEKSDLEGFIAVHANGVSRSWNAGACCGDAMKNTVDDVKFVGAMLDELQAKLCVDERRVFATGMSNGGFLSHRLACELSDRIAAIAPVAGVNGMETCTPKRPVPVLQFHGTSDTLVPYLGNTSFPSVNRMIREWAKRNGCSDKDRETHRKGDAHCTTFETCIANAEVTLCTVDGGGHTWPGGMPVPALGHTTPFLSATDRMWSFFVDHPMD